MSTVTNGRILRGRRTQCDRAHLPGPEGVADDQRMKRGLAAIVLSVCMLGALPEAGAQPGLRLGLTDDPDTLFVGFFYQAPISSMRSGYIALEPGFDVGFGDDVDFFTLRGTLNATFNFVVGRGTALYPLIGVSVYHINFDNGGDHTDAGLNLGGGFRFADRFNIEFAAGIDDLPDWTLSFGFLL